MLCVFHGGALRPCNNLRANIPCRVTSSEANRRIPSMVSRIVMTSLNKFSILLAIFVKVYNICDSERGVNDATL